MKAKEIVEIFSKLNPDEEVWATWITKKAIIDSAKDYEMTDENDNPIDVETLLNNYPNVIGDVCGEVDNDDELWETFNNTIDDGVRSLINELWNNQKEDVVEEELWDIEMEKTNVSNS
jgi:hypothetical protein